MSITLKKYSKLILVILLIISVPFMGYIIELLFESGQEIGNYIRVKSC